MRPPTHANPHLNHPPLHSTSLLKKNSCAQLSEALDELLAFSGPAVLGADTNLREKEVGVGVWVWGDEGGDWCCVWVGVGGG